MSELPPPSGKPVAFALIGDPWAEQARRHERHRADRRRRRRRVVARMAGAVGVVAAVGAAAFVAVTDDSSDRAADTSQSSVGTAAPDDGAAGQSGTTPTPSTASGTDSTDPPDDSEQTARVVDVWLLDRGDGKFDWGAVLSSNADVVRGDLDVSVVVLDDDGGEVFAEQVAVPRLAPDGMAAVGGVFGVEDSTPTRVEVTATLGTALPDESGVVFAVSAVRRVASGQVDRDDQLLGTVELIAGHEVPVRLAAMWRDDDGRVVAAVFDVLDPVDVGAAADFSLRLPRNFVPPGDPDTIVASVGAAA